MRLSFIITLYGPLFLNEWMTITFGWLHIITQIPDIQPLKILLSLVYFWWCQKGREKVVYLEYFFCKFSWILFWYKILLWYVYFFALIRLSLLSFWYFLKNTLIHLFFYALILLFLPWYQNTLIYLFLILQNALMYPILILALIFSSLPWYQNKKKRMKDFFYTHIALILKIRKRKKNLWTIFALITNVRKILQLDHFLYKKEGDFFSK